MVKNILYPTDFSDVSLKALDFIKELKECVSEEIVILHVINQHHIETLRIYAGKVNIEELQKELIKDAKRSLLEIKEELKEYGYKVRTIIKIGIPLKEILQTEKEEDSSLIIIGSHGRTNLEEMFLGSISEKVLRRSKKPVLVIRR